MKKILIPFIILVVLFIIGFLVYGMFRAQHGPVEVKNTVNDALARGVRDHLASIVEVYFLDNKTVPKKVSDLFTTNPNTQAPYITEDTPGLTLIEYKYLDSNTADICLINDSSIDQKCQRITVQ